MRNRSTEKVKSLAFPAQYRSSKIRHGSQKVRESVAGGEGTCEEATIETVQECEELEGTWR